MERIEIEASDMNPLVRMETTGDIYFSGRSMMEDASSFYAPVHKWLEAYMANANSGIVVHCDLSYFNSSSAKQLLKVLMTIDDSDVNAKVIWHYPKENDVLYDRGAELAIMVDIPFEFSEK